MAHEQNPIVWYIILAVYLYMTHFIHYFKFTDGQGRTMKPNPDDPKENMYTFPYLISTTMKLGLWAVWIANMCCKLQYWLAILNTTLDGTTAGGYAATKFQYMYIGELLTGLPVISLGFSKMWYTYYRTEPTKSAKNILFIIMFGWLITFTVWCMMVMGHYLLQGEDSVGLGAPGHGDIVTAVALAVIIVSYLLVFTSDKTPALCMIETRYAADGPLETITYDKDDTEMKRPKRATLDFGDTRSFYYIRAVYGTTAGHIFEVKNSPLVILTYSLLLMVVWMTFYNDLGRWSVALIPTVLYPIYCSNWAGSPDAWLDHFMFGNFAHFLAYSFTPAGFFRPILLSQLIPSGYPHRGAMFFLDDGNTNLLFTANIVATNKMVIGYIALFFAVLTFFAATQHDKLSKGVKNTQARLRA